jgi:L-asparaginase/Glu-tRNA(Gln) amidotransferase subunit D
MAPSKLSTAAVAAAIAMSLLVAGCTAGEQQGASSPSPTAASPSAAPSDTGAPPSDTGAPSPAPAANLPNITILGTGGTIAGTAESHEKIDDDNNFVTGDNLNPQNARILLMLALTKTQDPRAVQGYFDRY